MKHGPLALIDANMPVIVTAPSNCLLESNIEEVRARGVKLYIFTQKEDEFINDKSVEMIKLQFVEEITADIYYTVPTQLFAYHVALIKGNDVDKPRNLSKSVTVE